MICDAPDAMLRSRLAFELVTFSVTFHPQALCFAFAFLGRFAPFDFVLCSLKFRNLCSQPFALTLFASAFTHNAHDNLEKKWMFHVFASKLSDTHWNAIRFFYSLTYLVSLSGSNKVTMPSFMTIGLKLLSLEWYRQINKETNRQFDK